MGKVNVAKMDVEKFGLKSGISSAEDTVAGANCYSGDGGDDGCDVTCDNDSACDVY